jgi:hypothetical protein
MSLSPSSTTFRDMVQAISPSWLQGFVGLRYMYSMAIQFDAIADAAAYAVRARFPDLAPPDAFQFLANDRQIDQGFQEPQSNFATRLTQWLDRWAHAGSPFGLLLAVRGFVSPDLPEVATVNQNGVWDYYTKGVQDSPSLPPTHSYQPGVVGWNWDSASWPFLSKIIVNGAVGQAWWRTWVIIWSTTTGPWHQTTQTYGDGSTWGGGESYGWTGSAVQANNLRALVKKWKSAGTWVPWIIVSFNDVTFQPSGTGTQPDGTYGTWSKVITAANGRPQYVPSRSPLAAYLSGVL